MSQRLNGLSCYVSGPQKRDWPRGDSNSYDILRHAAAGRQRWLEPGATAKSSCCYRRALKLLSYKAGLLLVG